MRKILLKKKMEFQTRANSPPSEETARKSKCFCSDESYIYGRDLSLGMSVSQSFTIDEKYIQF